MVSGRGEVGGGTIDLTFLAQIELDLVGKGELESGGGAP